MGVLSADVCFSSSLQGQPQQHNKRFQFSPEFSTKLSWKKEVYKQPSAECSSTQNSAERIENTQGMYSIFLDKVLK